MRLQVPTSFASINEWVRLAANAINHLINDVFDAQNRLATVEADNVTQDGRLTALETDVADHETRITTLETYTAPTFTFTPGTLPASPVAGMTAFDSSDNKLKCYDGSIWQALF